jgi:hypothetical protein
MLHRVPEAATYEETLEVLEVHFGDQQLATTYRSQLKTRIQAVRGSLNDFATAFKQLIHHGY